MATRIRHAQQPKLFDLGQTLPNGLIYRPDFITEEEEDILLAYFQNAALEHGTYTVHTGTAGEDLEVVTKRRHLGFGWGWDYRNKKLVPGEELPRFLKPLQRKIAKWLQIEPGRVAEALINEYTPGAAIGFHVDNEGFEKIIGVSLGGWCKMKFRPLRPKQKSPRRSEVYLSGVGASAQAVPRQKAFLADHRKAWSSQKLFASASDIVTLELEPRSAYIMQGPVRWHWQHSVAPVPRLRYSITFRTLPAQAGLPNNILQNAA